MSAGAEEGVRRVGAWTRLGLGLQVGLSALLAVGVAVLLTWLAERPGIRLRLDLTEAGENTLDETTRGLLERLPEGETIEIDAFLRPLPEPLHDLSIEAIDRTLRLLMLLDQYRSGLVRVRVHDLFRHPAGDPDIQARLRELGYFQLTDPMIVVTRGERHVPLRLIGDLAEFDIGSPGGRGRPYVPPRLVAFHAEEALVRALLKVTQDARPRVLFSNGHGERALYGDADNELGRLHSALVEDGFRVAWWTPEEDGPVPEDCSVLAIIGPTEPFSERQSGWIRQFVEAGGRLILAPPSPHPDGREAQGPGTVASLLESFGLKLGRGIVCTPVPGVGGRPTDGEPECAFLTITAGEMSATHPITEPLRRGDRRARTLVCRPLERGRPPQGGVLLELLASSEITWLDQASEEHPYDLVWQKEDEPRGPFALAMVSVFPPRPGERAPKVVEGERPEARVVAFGTADFFRNDLLDTNRDLLLNTFNWAASREFRVTVSRRNPEARRLDLSDPEVVSRLQLVALWLVPGLFLALGALTFWSRRR